MTSTIVTAAIAGASAIGEGTIVAVSNYVITARKRGMPRLAI